MRKKRRDATRHLAATKRHFNAEAQRPSAAWGRNQKALKTPRRRGRREKERRCWWRRIVESMKTNTASDEIHRNTSNGFIAKHAQQIMGFLEGFDRLRLRGTLRSLYCPRVMEAYLCAQHVKFKDFGQFVERTTDKVKAAAEALAGKLARPVA